jgi:AcrR family transcriptional regulator
MARKTKARKSGRPAQPLTKADLVALAAPVFAAKGVEGVSIREVAELAGIRKASVFHHFATKELLYHAVMDDVLSRLFELIVAARLDQGSFVERLDRLSGLMVNALAQRPQSARLLVRELMGQGPYLIAAAGGAVRVQETLEFTVAFLSAGMDDGAFRRADPRHLALSIAGLHLLPFAAADTASALLARDFLSQPSVDARVACVTEQVRLLCLAPKAAKPATRKG